MREITNLNITTVLLAKAQNKSRWIPPGRAPAYNIGNLPHNTFYSHNKMTYNIGNLAYNIFYSHNKMTYYQKTNIIVVISNYTL